MKTIQIFLYALLGLLSAALSALSAEVVPGVALEAQQKSYLNSLSVNPYYTLGFADFDGESKSGVGLEAALPLSKSVSVVAFGESDNHHDAFVDRAGAGLQFTGKLGALRPFGRIGLGYTFDGGATVEDDWFLRPQFGATLPFYTNGDFEAGLTASWALDVDFDGNATQRLFGGVGLKWSF